MVLRRKDIGGQYSCTMTLVVAWTSLVVALAALVLLRRQARKMAQLSELYWQLKYDHGELKAAVMPRQADPPPPAAFVPLASVKRPSS